MALSKVNDSQKPGAVEIRNSRVSQGIFHCKAAKREGAVWPSERHGEHWWLQLSNLSKGEPGVDGSEGIGKRQRVCGETAKRWVGLALVVSLDHESTSVGVVRCVIAPVASHGRLAVSERASRRQPTNGLNQGRNGLKQPTK